jgi:hypothetical protein
MRREQGVMETFIREVVGQGALFCLMLCAILIIGTLIIMLWSVIAGRLGPDASDDKVRRTFWRLMRKLIEAL